MLLRFLDQHCNANYRGSPYLHLSSPPRLEQDTTKVLFLYADPVDVVFSSFRRGLAPNQSIRLGSKDPSFPRNVESLAASGRDLLCLEEHFDAWMSPEARDYEILFVRYERLWDNLDAILQHIGLRADLAEHFPAKRKRNVRKGDSPAVIAQLQEIYGPLTEKMQRLRDVELL